MIVYLADFTHEGLLVASNVMPLAIGLIGANIVREIEGATVELFKYAGDLDRALGRCLPDVVGFSNYSWSCNLGMAYAQRIKARWPQVVVIAGGPNYGSTEAEHRDFWHRFPCVDFYVVKEGEQATVNLLRELAAHGFDVEATKLGAASLASCHWLQAGMQYQEALMPRVKSLDELPSAYTGGLMDKFFDGVLIPMTHTTRGCPFKCSFCTEGTAYYDKVSKRSTLSEDLEYIGARRGSLADLYISDANFGMFKEDRDKALAIAEVQRKYDWPRYIHVSGGKNHKERLLEVAAIIGGSMGVAASLQSTNQAVLDNVRRSNISLEQLTGVAREGSKIDANTYAEIILNLPGDTLEAHTQSLRDSVNAGLSYLRMYQLIMLPETDLNTQATRDKFGLQTMWRIMPRCFGRYSFQGEAFNCAEIEEIVVAQDSLSFDEYIACRELDLTVEIVHNANIFRELYGLCGVAHVEWFELVLAFHAKRHTYLPELYADFKHNTIAPLWESRDEALGFAQEHLGDYLDEKLGTNELFNGKAVAFFNLQEALHDALYTEAAAIGGLAPFGEYLGECRRFSLARKRSLLADDIEQPAHRFSYDFRALLESDFTEDPRELRGAFSLSFGHDAGQRDTIEQLVHQYGTTTTGLGRILLRAHVKKLFRNIYTDGIVINKGFENSYRRSTNLGD